jgi:transposase
MHYNLQGELTLMDNLDIKPNYAALGRKYGMDWRTIKKYHEGYKGKPNNRDKPSKLDLFKNEITDKLTIKRVTVIGVNEFMVKKYGIEIIGSYTNFMAYVKKHKLKPNNKSQGHPRMETLPGVQAQVDWKEDISLVSRYGEIFVINIFHIALRFSRYNHLNLSIQKRTDDVYRGLINGFEAFGGVPKEILFDNMSTVVNTHGKHKKPTTGIAKMAKDFGFRVRFCATRAPETKGMVEAKNKVLDWIRPYEGEFEDLDDLIRIIKSINTDMNIHVNDDIEISPTALFYKEREYLQSLPARAIIDQYLHPNSYRVSNEALIRYGNSKYSVDPKLIDEEVTVDTLENNLYIYYNGKLITYHPLNEKKINYKQEHYETLMKGKVKDTDMNERITENLRIMDSLLDMRKATVSPIEASKSADALIAYINQNRYGKWVINNYAHLSPSDRLVFIKGMNMVLPYVKNKDVFIERIKYSMKENLCKTIDFDCYVNDLMATTECECVLTDEGYEIIHKKYEKEINQLLKDMKEEYTAENEEHKSESDGSLDAKLPFRQGERCL